MLSMVKRAINATLYLYCLSCQRLMLLSVVHTVFVTALVNKRHHNEIRHDTSQPHRISWCGMSLLLSVSVLSHVFGAVDKTSSSFSAHGKIGNFIVIISLRCYYSSVFQFTKA